MRSKIESSAFADAVKKLSSFLRPSPLSVLEQLRIDFCGDICRLSVTDLHTWVSVELPAQGDTFSALIADTPKLIKASRHYEGTLCAELMGEPNASRLMLRTRDRTGGFRACSVADWPEMPLVEPVQRFVVHPKTLLARVKRIFYASAESAKRPALGGVRFEGNALWCVDGYRLALSRDDSLTVRKPFILPANTLRQLAVFGDEAAELAVGARHAMLSTANVRLCCRLLEPSDSLTLENAMPKDFTEQFQIERNPCLKALRYLIDCTDRKKPTGVLFDQGELRCGCFSAHIDVRGECSLCIALDPRYLRETLEAFDADWVTVCANHAASPIVLNAGPNDSALILPIRLPAERRSAA